MLEPLEYQLKQKIDCPEIQADTIEEVVKYSSGHASDLLEYQH